MVRTSLLVCGGTLAVLATSSVICLQIFASVHIDEKPALKGAAAASAALESVALLMLGWLAASQIFWPRNLYPSQPPLVVFGAHVAICLSAAIASTVALVYLSQSRADDAHNALLAATKDNILIGSSVALLLAVVSQLSIIVARFAIARRLVHGAASDGDGDSQRTPTFKVKAIRYSQTSPGGSQSQDNGSLERKASVPSVASKSTMDTISSIRTSVSHAIRPASSRTRLLSAREKRRVPSLDSTPCRSSTENSFDSWDTSSVDAHNRQVVLEMSSSPTIKPPCLETIPASPTASRSPSPGKTLDLEPPPPLRRSRSYSASTLQQLEDSRTSSSSELHIHPLFRSDSPTPPPVATPGTVVVAAPNAGKVITRRESKQSLKRMRSGSLPAGPSPLSRQTSMGGAQLRRQEEAPQGDREPGWERSMTPPIPEWLLSPSMQASLAAFSTVEEVK